MNKSEIGKLLRAYRKEHKKTLKNVAEAIQASSSYVSQIEKGIRHPSDKALHSLLVKAFDLRPTEADELIGSWRIQTYSQKSGGKKPSKDISNQVLPYYETIDRALPEITPTDFRPYYLEDESIRSDLFLWELKDDSMQPYIPPGALLVINKNTGELVYDSLVLALIEGKAVVRFFQKRDDKIKLFAANSAYPVFFGEKVTILGKIVQMVIDI